MPDPTVPSATLPVSAQASPTLSISQPSPSPDLPPQPVHLVGHALPYYPDFAGWVAQWDGLATVEITSIGEVQWNTADGARPPEEELRAGLSGESGVDYFIGRPIEFRVLEVLRGTAVDEGDTDTYWLPGGSVGADVMDTHPHFAAEDVAVGARAMAFTFATPIDFGGSGTQTRTGFLFLVDKTGRVLTLAPDEEINVNDVRDHLP